MPSNDSTDSKLQLCDTLIFSVAGRLGSGASSVAKKLRDVLQGYNYKVRMLDVSWLIIGYSGDAPITEDDVTRKVAEFDGRNLDERRRTEILQNLGNELRADGGPAVLSAVAARDFIKPVLENNPNSTRFAFIIDSLKRPEEVAYLRTLFGKAFFAVGVVASESKRFDRLKQKKDYDQSDFDSLSERDQDERQSPSGQRAVKTVLTSDYFVANDHATQELLSSETERFVSLVFQAGVSTPRSDEFGMNVAFKAAAKSACLSRQVGAAIFDVDGELLSTGCNDVPKKGGGLYTSESPHDLRCWALGGKCYNDEEKRIIVDGMVNDVAGLLVAEHAARGGDDQPLFKNEEELKNQLRVALAGSRIKQLIEFSRAVHAEMNAILAIARTAKRGVVGSTLYCTTYPCHNCAKHIVDAGVDRVVYLEPYSKSLAAKLHQDTIDDSSSTRDPMKVAFRLYNGVSPRRYAEFFDYSPDFPRKNSSGRYIDRGDNKGALKPALAITIDEFNTRLNRLLPNSKGVSDGTTTPE